MANVTIGHIIENLVQVTLNDTSSVTWSQETLLDWANQGERKIVSLVPQANPVIEPVQLVAGIKQAIPSGGITFINAVRNMGAAGTTPGRAVALTTTMALAAFVPDWNKVYDINQGTVTYVLDTDYYLKDTTQDFGDWETDPTNAPAVYQVVVINSDTTIAWGYVGDEGSAATDIWVYKDINLTTKGWNGTSTSPSGKTPASYQVLKAVDTDGIYNAMPEPRDPTTYYVYPSANGINYIELEYADTPTVIAYDGGGTWKASSPTIKEGYVDALVSYILWRAFTQDSGVQGTRQRAIDALGAFYQGLGL